MIHTRVEHLLRRWKIGVIKVLARLLSRPISIIFSHIGSRRSSSSTLIKLLRCSLRCNSECASTVGPAPLRSTHLWLPFQPFDRFFPLLLLKLLSALSQHLCTPIIGLLKLIGGISRRYRLRSFVCVQTAHLLVMLLIGTHRLCISLCSPSLAHLRLEVATCTHSISFRATGWHF